MSANINACTPISNNPPGRQCRGVRIRFRVRTGRPFQPAGPMPRTFRVDYFKYGSSPNGYTVQYTPPNQWSCTCPDFVHRRRARQRCCKHIQGCIDKINEYGSDRYQQFLRDHIHEALVF